MEKVNYDLFQWAKDTHPSLLYTSFLISTILLEFHKIMSLPLSDFDHGIYRDGSK